MTIAPHTPMNSCLVGGMLPVQRVSVKWEDCFLSTGDIVLGLTESHIVLEAILPVDMKQFDDDVPPWIKDPLENLKET
jgi:hypothetical protein